MSAGVVVVAVAVYLLVPRLGDAFGGVGAEPPLRFSSTTVVVGPSDTGTITVSGTPSTGGTSACVRVRFTGPQAGAVRFGAEVADVPGSKGRVLVRVEEGTDAGDGQEGCVRFTPTRSLFDGPLRDLPAAQAGPWTPSGPQVRTYRVSLSPEGVVADAVSALLRWEAAAPNG